MFFSRNPDYPVHPVKIWRAFGFAGLLSPLGFIAPAQSASRPLPLANPFRHFPHASNPKWLKSPQGGARGWPFRQEKQDLQDVNRKPDPDGMEIIQPSVGAERLRRVTN
jgi:hypothetical protein